MTIRQILSFLLGSVLISLLLPASFNGAAAANAEWQSATSEQLQQSIAHAEKLKSAPLIPRDDFLTRPVVGQAYLSPNSRHVIHKEHQRKRVSLILTDTRDGKTRVLATSKAIGTVVWLSDSSGVLFQTADGVARLELGENSSPTLIRRFDHPDIDGLFDADVDSPAHFFAQRYDAASKTTTLFRFGPNGDQEALYVSTEPITGVLQVHGSDRLFLKTLHQGLPAILSLVDDTTEIVLRCAYDEACRPVRYDADRNELWVIANHAFDLSQLLGIQLVSGEVRRIHHDPLNVADIDSVRVDPDTGQPLLATYWRDVKTNYGLTDDAARHAFHIRAQFPDAHLSVTPRAPGRAWLITEQLPHRRAFAHYLYRPQDQMINRLPTTLADNDRLTPDNLAPVTAFTFTASDGMRVHAYVTLPRGVNLATAPLIVLPHGGPWARVKGTYEIFNQFLANRGYIVYEPNFRASSGYGRKYIALANREFGDGRVHDDIIEGMEFLLDHGIGNRQRLGVFGHSFGGFSTLGALAYTPDLFKVGVAGAPPTDLRGTYLRISRKGKFLRDNPMAPTIFRHRLGDIEDVEAMASLHQQSPLAQANRVARPLLIMAGRRDDRVSADEVLEYAIAMDDMAKPFSLLLAEEEGHSYRRQHTREAYLYLLETLLAKYLGGQREPLSTDDRKLSRFIQKSLKIDRLGLAASIRNDG